jgi:hypothetical protein
MAVLAEDQIACSFLLYFRSSTNGTRALIYFVQFTEQCTRV